MRKSREVDRPPVVEHDFRFECPFSRTYPKTGCRRLLQRATRANEREFPKKVGFFGHTPSGQSKAERVLGYVLINTAMSSRPMICTLVMIPAQ